jgi:hypothetical protein
MNDERVLRGIELRYALTLYLFQHGPATVPDLIDALEHQGFGIPAPAGKSISDALRWEMGHGRVRRLARGKYGPVSMPRATEHRIHARVMALRSEAALQAAGPSDDSFWDALLA